MPDPLSARPRPGSTSSEHHEEHLTMTHGPSVSASAEPRSDMTAWAYEIMPPQKLAVIGLIIFAVIIPNLLIFELIAERERRQTSVESEFTRVWGPPQQIYSPILVVPYRSGAMLARQFVRLAPTSL